MNTKLHGYELFFRKHLTISLLLEIVLETTLKVTLTQRQKKNHCYSCNFRLLLKLSSEEIKASGSVVLFLNGIVGGGGV
jgi:DNA-directed RNA polymerase subunit RPC12/RpoP